MNKRVIIAFGFVLLIVLIWFVGWRVISPALETKKLVRSSQTAVTATYVEGVRLTKIATAWTLTPTLTKTPTLTYTPTSTNTPTYTSTFTFTSTPDPNPPSCIEIGQEWISSIDKMTLMCVPAGEFTMGNTFGNSFDKPVHDVYLDAYWIDQTEVTNDMFTKFITATGYETEAEKKGQSYIYDGTRWNQVKGANWQHPEGPTSDLSGLGSHPVINVSWNDAFEYCKWVVRDLPTEAQWEKAARGTDQRDYPWGNEYDETKANIADINAKELRWSDVSFNDGYKKTAPVGSYLSGASPYGALDMAGNVWEWVADWFDDYSSGEQRNPTGPASGRVRVTRGFSWWDIYAYPHSTFRNYDYPDSCKFNQGFRCAYSQP